MKLIITIPKGKYCYIQGLEQDHTDYATTRMLYHAVKHGKPCLERGNGLRHKDEPPAAGDGLEISDEEAIEYLKILEKRMFDISGAAWLGDIPIGVIEKGINAIKELQTFRKKDEPGQVRYEGDGYADGNLTIDYAYCPECDHEIEADSENWYCDFCPNCGKRLRWEE